MQTPKHVCETLSVALLVQFKVELLLLRPFGNKDTCNPNLQVSQGCGNKKYCSYPEVNSIYRNEVNI